MSKTWTFIGGVLAGIVSVFAAAGVATGLEARKGSCCTEEEAKGEAVHVTSTEVEEG